MNFNVEIAGTGLGDDHLQQLVSHILQSGLEVCRDTKIYEGEATLTVTTVGKPVLVLDSKTGKLHGVCRNEEEAQRVKQQAADTMQVQPENIAFRVVDPDTFFQWV